MEKERVSTKLALLWPYRQDDITSQKYLDCVISGVIKDGNARVKHWILNPDFAYRHLDVNQVKLTYK